MTQVIVEKAPAEKFKIGLYYWPPDVDAANTILTASVAVSPVVRTLSGDLLTEFPSALILDGDAVISGQQVMQMIYGGTGGLEYTVQFTITTSNGSIYCSPDHDAIRVKVI